MLCINHEVTDVDEDPRFQCNMCPGKRNVKYVAYLIGISQFFMATILFGGCSLWVVITEKPEFVTTMAFQFALWPDKQYMPIKEIRSHALQTRTPDPRLTTSGSYYYWAVFTPIGLLGIETVIILTLFIALKKAIRPLLFLFMVLIIIELIMTGYTIVSWLPHPDFWTDGSKYIGPLAISLTHVCIKLWFIKNIILCYQYFTEKKRINRKPIE